MPEKVRGCCHRRGGVPRSRLCNTCTLSTLWVAQLVTGNYGEKTGFPRARAQSSYLAQKPLCALVLVSSLLVTCRVVRLSRVALTGLSFSLRESSRGKSFSSSSSIIESGGKNDNIKDYLRLRITTTSSKSTTSTLET